MLFPSARAPRRLRRLAPPTTTLALLALSALLLCAAPSAAQVGGIDGTGNGGMHTIQGRLVGPSGRRSDLRLKVRLESSSGGDNYVFSDANGTFRFTSLSPGSYTIVVEGGSEFESSRETVLVESSTISTSRGVIGTPFARPITVQVYLRPKRGATEQQQSQPGVLSAALANVPKPAADLYLKGVEAARKNDNEAAATLFKQAVETYPNFPLALSELGVLYLKLKRPEKAAETLSAALKLVPDEHGTLLAYGRALLELKRPAEAEEQFRKALKRNASSPWAHFYLGVTLLRRRDFGEAERELRAAIDAGGGEIAMIHYYLGGIYWERKEYKRAADELETFLRLAPDAPEAARVRSTVKEFRAKQ